MVKLSYEQPSLKKYGTMKELTFSSSGSTGDTFGAGNSPPRGGDPKPFTHNNANSSGAINSDAGTQNPRDPVAVIRNNDR
ncbi:hypothetical protein NIES4074_66160 [Cylindrospermum sp. NIES-4074]|nr:hypothetical protein NIES4074_66160 [Cylindrospermum sp. NIES-4074]